MPSDLASPHPAAHSPEESLMWPGEPPVSKQRLARRPARYSLPHLGWRKRTDKAHNGIHRWMIGPAGAALPKRVRTRESHQVEGPLCATIHRSRRFAMRPRMAAKFNECGTLMILSGRESHSLNSPHTWDGAGGERGMGGNAVASAGWGGLGSGGGGADRQELCDTSHALNPRNDPSQGDLTPNPADQVSWISLQGSRTQRIQPMGCHPQ